MSNNYKNILEEAYYFESDKIIFITQVKELLNANQNSREFLRGKLFCPYCNKAELTFVNSKFGYLRTSLNSYHQDSCEFNRPVITPKKLSAFLNKEYNQTQIYEYLRDLMYNLYVKGTNLSSTTYFTDKYDATINTAIQERRILRRNFNNGVTRDDESTTKLYYGQGLFTIKSDPSWSLCYLQIVSAERKKIICSLTFSKVVFDDFCQTINLKENILYNIAFFGEMSRTDRSYYTAKIDSITQVFAQKAISS